VRRLGYTTRPMRVVRIENFSLEEILSAAEFRRNYEVALIFSTKYEPGPAPWDRWRAWTELKTRFFGFHRDLPPAAVAKILAGHIVFSEQRQGQWVAVIEMERVEVASRLHSVGAGFQAGMVALASPDLQTFAVLLGNDGDRAIASVRLEVRGFIGDEVPAADQLAQLIKGRPQSV